MQSGNHIWLQLITESLVLLLRPLLMHRSRVFPSVSLCIQVSGRQSTCLTSTAQKGNVFRFWLWESMSVDWWSLFCSFLLSCLYFTYCLPASSILPCFCLSSFMCIVSLPRSSCPVLVSSILSSGKISFFFLPCCHEHKFKSLLVEVSAVLGLRGK